MILGLDIGNTNIEIGLLNEEASDFNIIKSIRYYTKLDITSDQLGIFILNFLQLSNIDPNNIKKLIFSSVVPPINNLIREMSIKYLTKNVIEVDETTKIGIRNCYKNPREVGSDRLVNACAAFYLYKKDCLIVDMGTATTICVVTQDGRYLGGTIFPGILTSTKALTSKAARLSAIKIQTKQKLLSDDTLSAIESGVYFSNYYAIKGMLKQLAAEVGINKYLSIGTGGFVSLFSDAKLFDIIEPELTLKGLKIISDINKNIN